MSAFRQGIDAARKWLHDGQRDAPPRNPYIAGNDYYEWRRGAEYMLNNWAALKKADGR